jgi:hypothetical protein
MGVPTTEVDICNLALDRLGQRAIASIETPTTEIEEVCARHYPAAVRELLRRFIFNFSKKYAVLTKSATKTPAFGYTSAYQLPNDFVRLLALGDIAINDDTPAGLYDMSEGHIFTDAADAAGLKISYVYDDPAISTWDPLFVRLVTLHLAANMAYKFTLKNSLIDKIRQDADDLAVTAAAVAGQEKPPRRIERSKIVTARRMGSTGSDPRYY